MQYDEPLRHTPIKITPIIAFILLGVAASAAAKTWYVRPDGTGDAPTIQAAVDSATGGDIVMLSDGVFTGTGNRDVLVGKAITLRSESGDAATCIIDCGGSAAEYHRAFLCDATPLVFDGFTVRNGYHSEAGAMDIQSNLWGELTISRCRFFNNNGGYGGAIRCVLLGSEDYLISGCVFSGNYSYYYGAGIFLERHLDPDGLCRIENCTFFGNYAYYGAALAEWLYEPPLGIDPLQDTGTYMAGCTIAGNSGASSIFGTAMSGERLIVAYNQTATPFINSRPVLSCTDVYGNTGGDWIGVISDQYRVRGNIQVCPSFCSLAEGDLHLCDESPCLPGQHPDDYDCGLIGALAAGCSCGPSATHPTTWGAIKGIYR
jgi:hypothetical protein